MAPKLFRILVVAIIFSPTVYWWRTVTSIGEMSKNTKQTKKPI